MEKIKDNKYDGGEFSNQAIKEYCKKCDLILSNFTSELKQRQSKKEISTVDVKDAYRRFNKKPYRDNMYFFYCVGERICGLLVGAMFTTVLNEITETSAIRPLTFCVFVIVLILFVVCLFKEYKDEI